MPKTRAERLADLQIDRPFLSESEYEARKLDIELETASQTTPKSMEDRTAAGSSSPPAWIVAAISLVAILVMTKGCGVFAEDKPETRSVADSVVAATDACQIAIKAQLKAPSTAKFSGERAKLSSDPLDVSRKVSSYSVTGLVESQNSFGAMVASTFICSAQVPDDPKAKASASVVSITER